MLWRILSLLVFLVFVSCRNWQPFSERYEREPVIVAEGSDRGAEFIPTPTPPSEFVSPTGISIPQMPFVYGEVSRQGRPLHYWVLGEGPTNVLLFGAIHGDERSSSAITYQMLSWLFKHPHVLDGVRVVVAPLVNPDGYAANTRENQRGVDLNRNFPAENWERGKQPQTGGLHPLSEPETRFLMALLEMYPPACAVALHGAAACVNWDGPAADLAAEMSSLCGLPAKPSIGYPTPGSFGTYLGIERGIATITYELADNQRIPMPWDRHRDALLLALDYARSPQQFMGMALE